MTTKLEGITKDKSIYDLRKCFPKFPLQRQANKIVTKSLVKMI